MFFSHGTTLEDMCHTHGEGKHTFSKIIIINIAELVLFGHFQELFLN